MELLQSPRILFPCTLRSDCCTLVKNFLFFSLEDARTALAMSAVLVGRAKVAA